MSNRKFNFPADREGNSQTNSFNVLSSQFGDGYRQSTSVGINNKRGVWNYTRTAYKDEILQIKTFFDDHKGSESFLWDSPLDGEVRVIASEYTLTHIGGLVWRISTTFTQDFKP